MFKQMKRILWLAYLAISSFSFVSCLTYRKKGSFELKNHASTLNIEVKEVRTYEGIYHYFLKFPGIKRKLHLNRTMVNKASIGKIIPEENAKIVPDSKTGNRDIGNCFLIDDQKYTHEEFIKMADCILAKYDEWQVKSIGLGDRNKIEFDMIIYGNRNAYDVEYNSPDKQYYTKVFMGVAGNLLMRYYQGTDIRTKVVAEIKNNSDTITFKSQQVKGDKELLEIFASLQDEQGRFLRDFFTLKLEH